MILNALEEKPLPVYGDGSNVRDWLYVEDHARALHLILTKGRLGEKYNVGGRNERTNLAVVESICDTLDRLVPAGREPPPPHHLRADRPGHDHRYAIDAGKLERELGWRAQDELRERPRQDRALVSRQPGLVGAAAQGRLCRRAARTDQEAPPARDETGTLAMKILVAGSQGQLARALVEQATGAARRPTSSPSGRPQLDLADTTTVVRAFDTERPQLVINAAAYTAVDKAESEPQAAFAINRDGAGALAAAAKAHGCPDHPRFDRLRVRRRQARSVCRN